MLSISSRRSGGGARVVFAAVARRHFAARRQNERVSRTLSAAQILQTSIIGSRAYAVSFFYNLIVVLDHKVCKNLEYDIE